MIIPLTGYTRFKRTDGSSHKEVLHYVKLETKVPCKFAWQSMPCSSCNKFMYRCAKVFGFAQLDDSTVGQAGFDITFLTEEEFKKVVTPKPKEDSNEN